MAETQAAESSANNDDWDTNTGTWETAAKYKRDWRIEFMARGRYWILRRGSGKNRQSIYKGKVANLNNPIRKAEYVANSEIYHARRAAAAARRAAATGSDAGDGSGSADNGTVLHA